MKRINIPPRVRVHLKTLAVLLLVLGVFTVAVVIEPTWRPLFNWILGIALLYAVIYAIIVDL
jgi:hypothetical protein